MLARTPLNASALNDFDQRVKNAVPGFVQKTWNDSPPSLDTAGIQAEIDAANALWSAGAGRQIVFLPSGDYNITYTGSTVQPAGSSTPYAYALLMKSGVELVGIGKPRLLATQVPNTTLSVGPITLPQASIQVTSTASFPSTGILNFAGTANTVNYTSKDATHFLGCTGGTATLANGTAVALDPRNTIIATPAGSVTTDWAVRNIILDGQTSLAIETEHFGMFIGPAKRFEIEGCEFKGTLGKNIFGFGDNTGVNGVLSRYRIARNYIHDSSSNAIHPGAFGATDFEIVDNQIHDSTLTGGAESIIMFGVTAMARYRIAGNDIRNWGTVDLWGTDGSFIDNYLSAPTGALGPGIKVVGSNIKVNHNTIDVTAASSVLCVAIALQDGNGANAYISGNTIYRNNTTTAGRGISVLSTWDHLTITDNHISGAATATEADISLSNTTDSKVAGNTTQNANGLSLASSCLRCVVDGNIVSGGQLTCDCTDSTVSNNRVVAAAGNTTCLEVNSGSVVTGNDCRSSAISGSAGVINVFGTDSVVTGNRFQQTAATNQRIIAEQTGADRNLYADNQFVGTGTLGVNLVGAASRVRRNTGYISENYGATSVADGGTVTHGLATTPTRVNVTPSIGSQMVSVTAKGATTFTVAIKTGAGAAGTTQTVYWQAEI